MSASYSSDMEDDVLMHLILKQKYAHLMHRQIASLNCNALCLEGGFASPIDLVAAKDGFVNLV